MPAVVPHLTRLPHQPAARQPAAREAVWAGTDHGENYSLVFFFSSEILCSKQEQKSPNQDQYDDRYKAAETQLL